MESWLFEVFRDTRLDESKAVNDEARAIACFSFSSATISFFNLSSINGTTAHFESNDNNFWGNKKQGPNLNLKLNLK